MLSLKLAWRNIWRNRRRTLITTLSIVVAVFLSAVTRSTQEGQYENMIQNTVGTYTGYIQIHQSGYWDEPSLDNSFEATDSLMNLLTSESGISQIVPRMESFALAAGRQVSRPAMVNGIDIEAEKQLSAPHTRLTKGSYFSSNSEQAVLVGDQLLRRLNAEIGDSLVLIGQGFRGMTASGLYRIKGTVTYTNPEMSGSLVYLPLETSRQFFAAPDRFTTLALLLDDPGGIDRMVERLKDKLPDRYEVLGWREMMPELVQAIQADRGSGIIILMVLYMVVGFGILGTVLMMIAERSYEFGVMLSVGTPRMMLGKILGIEILLMALLGAGTGILTSMPVIWYFMVNPIYFSGQMEEVAAQYSMEPVLAFSSDPGIFTSQALIVFLITLVFSILPLIRAMRINPVEAMRD